MTSPAYKRLSSALSAVVFVLLIAACKFFWDAATLHIHVAFASEQTEIFDNMRTQALSADAVGAAQSLDYVVHYYPSGTKQVRGSLLDQMVERERTNTILEIIAHLRTKTGEDLGDNAEKWIQKYAVR